MTNKEIKDFTEATSTNNNDEFLFQLESAGEYRKITSVNLFSPLTTAVGLNTTHRTSNGTDHSYIDQDVTSTSSPTFVEPQINSFQFGLSPVTALEEGMVQWTSDENTIDVGMTGGVVGQMFHEDFFNVMNQTGSDLINGRPIMFAGVLGASGRLKGQHAIANGTIPSSYTVGLATETIANGEYGKVTWRGKVRSIDTTGTDFGETWNDGDILYVSETTAGYLTNVKPEAPNYQIEVAVVILAHSNGTLMVRPTWHCAITDLTDVNGTALTTNGQMIVWDNDNSYFDFTSNINDFAPALGADDNYVTDAEKVIIGNTSGTNSGDQASGDFTHNSLAGLNDGATYQHITTTQETNFGTAYTHSGLTTGNPHSVNKTDVSLGNVPNTDCTNADNITSGTISSNILPPVALTTVQVAVSQVAMLALTTEEGDVVVRSDENKSYMRNAGVVGDMTDFTELQTPTDSVLSVNGETGTVILNTSHVNDSTDRRYVTDAESTVIDNTSGTNTGDNSVNTLYSSLVTNATHTGEVTGATVLTVDSTAISNKTLVTAVGADHVMIVDATDGTLKKALISDFASAGGDMAASTYDPATIAEQLVGLTATQTLTNKTLTSPIISSISNTGTLTLPTTTGTVALTSDITGTNSGTNTGDNSANTLYASDYRAANFIAGTNYQTPLVADTDYLTPGTAATTYAPVLTSDQNYVSDIELGVLQATSGANTGDNSVNTLYSSLVTNATHSGDATGDTALTLATVNANVGSFTNANITVNAKGLITAASTGTGGSGDVTKVGTPVNNEIGVWTGDGTIEGDTNFQWTGTALNIATGDINISGTSTNQIILPVNGSTTPTIAFGDGDTGFAESSDDNLVVITSGSVRYRSDASTIYSQTTGGFKIFYRAASSTEPSFCFSDDNDTGMGSAALNQVSLIAGGAEIVNVSSTGIDVTGNIVVSGTVDGIDIATDVAANTAFTTTPSTVITAGTDLTWSGNTLNYTGSGGGITWSTPIDSSITVDTDGAYDLGTTTALLNAVYTDDLFVQDKIIANGDIDTSISFSVDNAISLKAGNQNILTGTTSGIDRLQVNPDSGVVGFSVHGDTKNDLLTVNMSGNDLINIGGSIVVDTDSSYDIGTSTVMHSNIYADNLLASTKIISSTEADKFIDFTTADTISITTGGSRVMEMVQSGNHYVLINPDSENIGFICHGDTQQYIINVDAGNDTVTLTNLHLNSEMDAGAHSIGFTAQTATGDGTTTIDWKLGNKFHFTAGAFDETFTFTAPTNPGNFLLKIKQDATGGRDMTFPATVKWLGTEPTWADGGASKTIIMSMYFDGTDYWSNGTSWEA